MVMFPFPYKARKLALVSTLVLWSCVSYAQISFQNVTIDPSMLGPRTLFHAVLNNAAIPTEIVLEGDIKTSNGSLVLSFKTDPVRASLGIATVSAAQLTMRSFRYADTEEGRSARNFHRLPQGVYHFCLRLNAPQAEAWDEYCDRVESNDFIFLDLVQPWNGDSIDEVRPALTWTMSGSMPTVASADVRITLVPMPPEMGPAQALAAERPLFMVPQVKERTIIYPPGIPDLEPGKCYAWQAERLVGSRVSDRSDPWGFCVRRHKEPQQNKYVHLDRLEPGATYQALDNKIFFRYDEPYASSRLNCLVHDGKNGRIEPQVLSDTDGQHAPGLRSVGANLYEVDLQPYGLKPGHYYLVVRDEKGRDRTLKFHVTR